MNLIPLMKKVAVLICVLVLYKCSTKLVLLQGYPLPSTQALERNLIMHTLEARNKAHICLDTQLISIAPIQEAEQSLLMHSVRQDSIGLVSVTPLYTSIMMKKRMPMLCGSISCTAGNTLTYE